MNTLFQAAANDDLTQILRKKEGGIGETMHEFQHYCRSSLKDYQIGYRQRKSVDHWISMINSAALDNLNSTQRVVTKIDRRFIFFRLMMRLTQRNKAVSLATKEVVQAWRYEQYFIAARYDLYLSKHYAKIRDLGKSEKYFNDYEKAVNLMLLEDNVDMIYQKFVGLFEFTKKLNAEAAQKLHQKMMTLVEGRPISERIRYFIYRVRMTVAEINGDFESIINIAEEAIAETNYLSDNCTFKVVHTANYINACLMLKRFRDGLKYENFVLSLPQNTTNKAINLLALQRIYLSTGRIDESIRIGHQCVDSVEIKQVKEMSRMVLALGYLSSGDVDSVMSFRFDHYYQDKQVMGANVRLIQEWKKAILDPCDINESLTMYISRHMKEDTRMRCMLNLMTLLPYYGTDKFSSKESSLLAKMKDLEHKAQPNEAELVDFEVIWNIIKTQVSEHF